MNQTATAMALSNISLWIRDAWAGGKYGCWRGAGVIREMCGVSAQAVLCSWQS